MNLPEEFKNNIKEILKEEFDEFINSYNKPHFQGLRANALKISAPSFYEMAPFNLKLIPWTNNGFYYDDNIQPAKHPFYYAGLYYIQEPSAMAPGTIIPINYGDKVLDLCAAPGGKTTQIAERLNGTGLLVSNDISASRAKAIVKNIEILGIKNAIVISENPEKLKQYFEGFFDKILVDAPCSGEGMFRKDSSMLKCWNSDSNKEYASIQREILKSAAAMLKPGGYILYSTCTFSEIENEKIILEFLKDNSSFKLSEINAYKGFENGVLGLSGAKRLWPHKLEGEGHFIALLKKEAGEITKNKYYKCIPMNKNQSIMLEQFEKENLKITFERDQITVIEDRAYLIPKDMPDTKKIRVLRSGWHIGSFSKHGFEPSQALASALKKEEAKNIVDFAIEDQRVVRYLKGESLDVEANKGYQLVCVEGFSLGWAKKTGNLLKNKYSSGWRWQ